MKKLAILIALLIQIPIAHAYTECVPAQSTSTVTEVETQNFPTIVINEVSFKDTASDFVELYIKDDKNTGSGANIKGLEISSSEGVIQKIETDTIAKTGDFILYNATNGLVATNNIVEIKSPASQILDAVCWTDETPTDSQQQKITDLVTANAWTGTCINGTNIANNASIGRNLTSDDTNQLTDWQQFLHKTASAINEIRNNPPTAIITIQQGSASGTAPLSINLTGADSSDPDNDTLTFAWNFGDNTTYLTENPPNHSYATAGNYTITLTVTDSFSSQNSTTLAVIAQTAQTSDDGTPETDPDPTTPPPSASIPSIVINEFMPDPEGTDTNNEWIELKNTSSEAINIQGYKLDDIEGGSSPYAFPSTTFQPNEIKAFYSNVTKITLNNDTDRVRLFNAEGTTIDEILYEKPESGKSFAQNSQNQWSATTIPTPNAENQFPENTQPSFTCTKISQNGAVSSSLPNADTNQNPPDKNASVPQEFDIEITEIMPNPKGIDTNQEWIELKNNSDGKVNLEGLSLQTSNQKRKFTFKATQIKSNGYLAISSKESKLTLKNSNDKITLLDKSGEIIDEVQYSSTKEALSYAKIREGNEETWTWTSDITKNAENPYYEIFDVQIVSTEENQNSFTALKNDKTIQIKYSESVIPKILASNIIKPGKIFAVKAKTLSDNSYELKQIDENPAFEKFSKNGDIPNENVLKNANSTQNTQSKTNNSYLIIAIIIAAALITALLIFITHSIKDLRIFHFINIKQRQENSQNQRPIQNAGESKGYKPTEHNKENE
ncbi:MAG: PKD domain-containing protein [Candidatus Peregrinibacteria bacterium GW2011_GWC2_39_14]|nr:MAG: PKD domain-containing protein [Candidatus Peregrinibacteria bacterium GW2011_GWC2_39_14]